MNARKKLTPSFLALAAAVGLATAGSTANASAEATTANEVGARAVCAAGKSCYYDLHGGDDRGRVWVAPSCGWQDLSKLSSPFNDKLSSVSNQSVSTIVLYNWVGFWEAVVVIYPGQNRDLVGGYDNIVDAYSITC